MNVFDYDEVFQLNLGDQVTVENVSFEETPVTEPEAPSFWTRYGGVVQDTLRWAGMLILVIVALLFVVRPMVTAAASAASARPVTALPAGPPATAGALGAGDRPRTVAEIENQLDASMDFTLKSDMNRRLPALTRHVSGMAQKEPENTAKLIRSWIADQEQQ